MLSLVGVGGWRLRLLSKGRRELAEIDFVTVSGAVGIVVRIDDTSWNSSTRDSMNAGRGKDAGLFERSRSIPAYRGGENGRKICR